MKTETITYSADGLDMVGHLAWDETATTPRPGVLVFPEAFGLGEHAKSRAERLAREFGYVAFAADLHGGAKVVTDLTEAVSLIGVLRESAEKVRVRTLAPYHLLASNKLVDPKRLAAIGFCFGGTMSFELALTGVALQAAIGFHSGLAVTSPNDAKAINGKILALIGADDPSIPPDAREKFGNMLSDAGVDWQITTYGNVVHSFTNKAADKLGRPDFARYDAKADARSWQQMGNLLAESFGEAS